MCYSTIWAFYDVAEALSTVCIHFSENSNFQIAAGEAGSMCDCT